ncbi:MAG: integration host factor [Gammaproteobacteria bacterium]|nr:integration host factor [Gammaproteobacteria bacterium]
MAAKSRSSARKAPAKKAPARKPASTAKKPAARAAPAPKPTGPTIRTKLRKNDVINLISDETEVPKDQVRKVLEKREELIERALRPRSIGVFQDGSLVKYERYRRKATKKRMGRNLKTNEPIEIPAKPAHNSVKVKKLTKLKKMVGG